MLTELFIISRTLSLMLLCDRGAATCAQVWREGGGEEMTVPEDNIRLTNLTLYIW